MDDPSAPSEAAVRVLHEEARDHLEAVVAAIQDMDDKTSSLVRFNAVIVGVVTTGVSVGLRAHETLAGLEAVVVSLTVGLVAMVVSTVEGVRSYLKPDTEVGIDPEQLEEALDSSASEVDVRAEAVRVYRTGVEQNYLVLDHTANRFRRMLYALIVGLAFLTVGAVGLSVLGGK